MNIFHVKIKRKANFCEDLLLASLHVKIRTNSPCFLFVSFYLPFFVQTVDHTDCEKSLWAEWTSTKPSDIVIDSRHNASEVLNSKDSHS